MNETTTHGIYTGIGLDVETGGLDCRECACTQIAMQAVRLDTWTVIDRYQTYIYPYSGHAVSARRKVLRTRRQMMQEPEIPMKYEPQALAYADITMELLRAQGTEIRKVAAAVIDFAAKNTLSEGPRYKPVLIGQNVAFDIGFLQQIMNGAGLTEAFERSFSGTKDYYGNFQPHYIDTMWMGRLAFAAEPEISSYRLEAIASRLGVELDDAHDAAADVNATLDILGIYISRLRNAHEAGQPFHLREKTRHHFKI